MDSVRAPSSLADRVGSLTGTFVLLGNMGQRRLIRLGNIKRWPIASAFWAVASAFRANIGGLPAAAFGEHSGSEPTRWKNRGRSKLVSPLKDLRMKKTILSCPRIRTVLGWTDFADPAEQRKKTELARKCRLRLFAG